VSLRLSREPPLTTDKAELDQSPPENLMAPPLTSTPVMVKIMILPRKLELMVKNGLVNIIIIHGLFHPSLKWRKEFLDFSWFK
jgi:hypothetical protein